MLQFMIDHNICGMDLLEARVAKEQSVTPAGLMFRHPMPVADSDGKSDGSERRLAEAGLWLRARGWVELHSEEFDRQTRCDIEADVSVQSLVNPDRVARSAFTAAGDKTAEQRLVQSLETIWQQSRQEADSQTLAQFPRLGHIMVTQPGSQPRDLVPPTEEQLSMQEHIDAMVEREEESRQMNPSPATPCSPSESTAAESSHSQTPNISWTPFLAGMMSQSLSQPPYNVPGATADSPSVRTARREATGFSSSEVCLSLEGGLANANASASGRVVSAGRVAETDDAAEIEGLLDWMRNDDGQSKSVSTSSRSIIFADSDAQSDALAPMQQTSGEIESTDADGWTRAEREECENIMASQVDVDVPGAQDEEREPILRAVRAVGAVRIPQLDGTDNSPPTERRAKRSKNDWPRPGAELVKHVQKRKQRPVVARGSDEDVDGSADASVKPTKRKRSSKRSAVRRSDLGNILQTSSVPAGHERREARSGRQQLKGREAGSTHGARAHHASGSTSFTASKELAVGPDTSLLGREISMSLVGYGTSSGQIIRQMPDSRFEVVFDNGHTKLLPAPRVHKHLLPRVKKNPLPAFDTANQILSTGIDINEKTASTEFEPMELEPLACLDVFKAGDWAIVNDTGDLVKVLNLVADSKGADRRTRVSDAAVVQHWIDEPEHLWFQHTEFCCPSRTAGCTFVGAPPNAFEAVRRHILTCGHVTSEDLEPQPIYEVGKIICSCESDACRERRDKSLPASGCVWKQPLATMRPVRVVMQHRQHRLGLNTGAAEIAHAMKAPEADAVSTEMDGRPHSTQDFSEPANSRPPLSPSTVGRMDELFETSDIESACTEPAAARFEKSSTVREAFALSEATDSNRDQPQAEEVSSPMSFKSNRDAHEQEDLKYLNADGTSTRQPDDHPYGESAATSGPDFDRRSDSSSESDESEVQCSPAMQAIIADAVFAKAYDELVQHVPADRIQRFRSELLSQLESGQLAPDFTSVPVAIRNDFEALLVAFQSAKERTRPDDDPMQVSSALSSISSFQVTQTVSTRRSSFAGADRISVVVRPTKLPPSAAQLSGLPVAHQPAHYSEFADQRQFVFGGQTFAVSSTSVRALEPFESARCTQHARRAVEFPINFAHCITPAQSPPSAQDLLSKSRKRTQSTIPQARHSTVDNAGREVLAPPTQAQTQGSTPATSQEDEIRTCSPRYDEGIGFAEMAGTSATQGNSLGRLTAPKLPSQMQGFTPASVKADSSATSNSPATESEQIPLSSSSGRRKSVQFTDSPASSVSSASEASDEFRRLRTRRGSDVSQLSAVTQRTQRVSQAGFNAKPHAVAQHATQHLVVCSIEVHVQTRAQLLPDPCVDAIGAICYVIRHETLRKEQPDGYRDIVGCIISDDHERESDYNRAFLWSKPEWSVQHVASESALMAAFVDSIHRWDPDIIVGFEVEKDSIGYIVQRAHELQHQNVLDPPIQDLETTLSRLAPSAVAELSRSRKRRNEQNQTEQQARGARYMATHASDISIVGRHCLNLWRILRGEVKLNTYTPENVAQCVLQRHLPRVQHRVRTHWFRDPRFQQRAVAYCVARARLSLEVLDQLDIIGRTSELARVFGIDFYSVLWRGSQYRVESMMLRLAHRHDPPFLAISPTKQQVASQRSLEVIPLVMEPSSRLYTSPVIVLDFRSLYPSVIIAYNLCYSTCLGKIAKNNEDIGTTRKRLGALDDYSLPPGVLGELKGQLNLSPNEVMFVQRSTRQGILPRMLTEILEARIQVKKDLKTTSDPVVHRILNAKQYALKLIANVTYGYTSASFSGRMPCVDIADAIVAYGRETLENALRQIESNNNGANPNWNAKVQYGDTDSLFVELPGRSKEEAFAIGAEIERAVNAVNPRPVELEMEKVYHPCILLSKKRYVGYSWESLKQTEPIFDAKGIETIRRDSCPLVAKMEEKVLRILFESKDLSKIKRYCQRQWAKLLLQRVSMADLVFRREVKLGSYRSATNIPPAATVATKQMANDRMAEPRHGERVAFVVVYKGPAAPLRDCVVDPRAVLLPDSSLRINARYYIEKQVIPALARLLNIVGADVFSWWECMPRQYKNPLATMRFAGAAGSIGTRRTIDAYYQSRECVLCFEEHRGTGHYCAACSAQPARLAFLMQSRRVGALRQVSQIREICLSCCASIGLGGPRDTALADSCVSLDCAVHYERAKAEQYNITLQHLGTEA